MMALLLRDEIFTPYLSAGQGQFVVPSEPTDVWLGLLLNDKANTPIGYINIRTEPNTRDSVAGAQVRVIGRMRLNLGSFQGELAVNGEAWASPKEGLREFSFALRSGEHATMIAATVENGKVRGQIDTGGEKTSIDLAAGSAQMMTSAPGFGNFNMPSLAEGEEVFVETFDPLTMSLGKARVQCLGEETIRVMGKPVNTKVFLTDLSGMKSKAWVDSTGNVLRAETPIGFVLQRMAAEEALKLAVPKGGNGKGLLEFAAVKSEGPAPFRGATYMRLKLTGLEGVAQLPADDSQVPGPNGELVVEPRGPADGSRSLTGDELANALANDSFLQTDHPKIVAKAGEIVGNESGVWKKAMLLYEWVHASVKKNIVPSLPTSLDVLNTMEGDCNEHTMLYTALARASGVPTRMAIGLV